MLGNFFILFDIVLPFFFKVMDRVPEIEFSGIYPFFQCNSLSICLVRLFFGYSSSSLFLVVFLNSIEIRILIRVFLTINQINTTLCLLQFRCCFKSGIIFGIIQASSFKKEIQYTIFIFLSSFKNFNPVTTTGSKDKSIFKTPSIVTHYVVFFISLSATLC